MKILTVEQMRAIEQASVDHGVSLDQLQRNAAAAIARELARLPLSTTGPLLFLAGPGNNGRDALIASAILAEQGRSVRAYLAPKVASEDVLVRLRAAGAELRRESYPTDRETLRDWTRQASAVVDGLLGIGAKGAAREPIAGMITTASEVCATYSVPVVAVDLPSGIDADTGEVAGPAIRATRTLSLGCVKAGLLRFPAAEHVGELVTVEIGLPPETCSSIDVELITADTVAAILPPRPLDAHKGIFGRVLSVTGSSNFVGASYLVGAAAARTGIGIITLAVPAWQRAPLATLLPEATYLPLSDHDDPTSASADAQAVAAMLPSCTALAIGPGLGQGPARTALVLEVMDATRRGDRPIRTVVDADGLNALSTVDRWWERIGPGHVLTPHPGEMSRLTGLPARQVNEQRWEVARDSARRWNQTVLLKGPFTVIAAPDGRLWVNGAAVPALATGGSGDVLTGLIAGLMAQGMDGTDAARAAAFIHTAAASRVLAATGADRLLASDLLPAIAPTIASLQRR